MLSLARYLPTPFRPLDWLQRRRRRDDAGGEDEDGDEELDGDVEGERGICEGRCVLVGGVDAGEALVTHVVGLLQIDGRWLEACRGAVGSMCDGGGGGGKRDSGGVWGLTHV